MIGFDAVLKNATDVLPQLASSAVRAMAVAGAVGLALVVLRVKSASAQLVTWTGVLCAALVMPFLRWVLPPVQVVVPEVSRLAVMNKRFDKDASRTRDLLGHKERDAARGSLRSFAAQKTLAQDDQSKIPSAAEAARGGQRDGTTEVVPFPDVTLPSHPVAKDATRVGQPTRAWYTAISWLSVWWKSTALTIYLAIAGLMLARFLVGLFYVRRLAHAATAIDDPWVKLRLAAHSRAAGMVRVPQVAELGAISVPVTMRVMRPMILLPTDWREWDEMKLNAVIAHEVSHAARRDTLTQRLALLHRVIFWFSPLAWWLNRKLAALAEQASDEAALACGAERGAYANVLVEFLEALQAHPGRVRWQGMAMASLDQAERRVERILTWKGAVPMNFKSWMAVVAVMVALPLVYLTASASPASTQAVNAQPANAAPTVAVSTTADDAHAVAPVVVPDRVVRVVPDRGVVARVVPDAPVLAPVTPGAPVVGVAAPQIPLAWRGQDVAVSANVSARGGDSYRYAYDDDDEDGLRFVIVSGKNDQVTMSGSSEDSRHALKLKKTIPGDFIWFQRDEKSYIVRDAATIERARKLWEPQEELGKKQAALGKQQEALGQQQEALGKKMEEVRVNVPDVTPQIDKLKAELKAMGPNASVEQIGKVQEEIGELQSKLGELQSHAGDEQGKLGEEMGKLGEQQGKLGEEQGKLGEQQGELAQKATRELKSMLDEAIQKGTAQPE